MRLSVIEYDATTMSTVPFWMNGSRFLETVSTNSILSAGMPSWPAMILPTSMSKPSGLPVEGFLLPMPGWSYFTPILMAPAELRRSIVVPASKDGSLTTSYASESVVPPLPRSVSLSPHAVSARESAATPAARVRSRIGRGPFLPLGEVSA